MLNSSNLFSEPLLEYFHWTSKFVLSKTPLCCKVIRRHFLSKYSDEDKTKIEAEVPNLKYIWLRRHNNYERAISLYFSLKNRLWRTTKDSKKEYFKNISQNKYVFDTAFARKCYAEVSSDYHNNWSSYLKKDQYLEVDYEELIASPKEELKKIVNYMGLDFKDSMFIAPNSIPMKMPQTEEFIEKLKETIKKRPPLPPAKESNLDVYKMIKKN
jgi:LPS sulfotransferase NodH